MSIQPWSPFAPTVVYPAQETLGAIQRTNEILQRMARDISSYRTQSPTSLLGEPAYATLAEIRTELDRGGYSGDFGNYFDMLSADIHDLSTRLEWGLDQVVAEIREGNEERLRIAQHQTELRAREKYTSAVGLADRWVERAAAGELQEDARYQHLREVIARFREIISFNPSANVVCASLLEEARLQLLAGEYGDAEISLETSIFYADKRDGFDYRSFSLRLLGRLYFTQGRAAEAREQLRRAVRYMPTWPVAWYDLAQYLASGNKPEQVEALESLSRAIEQNRMFWYYAQKEPNFDPIREQIQEILEEQRRLRLEELRDAPELIERMEYWQVNCEPLADQMGGMSALSPAALAKDLVHQWPEEVRKLQEQLRLSNDYVELLQAKIKTDEVMARGRRIVASLRMNWTEILQSARRKQTEILERADRLRAKREEVSVPFCSENCEAVMRGLLAISLIYIVGRELVSWFWWASHHFSWIKRGVPSWHPWEIALVITPLAIDAILLVIRTNAWLRQRVWAENLADSRYKRSVNEVNAEKERMRADARRLGEIIKQAEQISF